MRLRLFILALGFACAFVAVPASAFADAPVVEGETDVQLWLGAQPGQLLVVVSATIPETAELPATVRIPLPAGMQLDWAGEILAEGEPDADPQRSYTLEQGTGGQYAELEISESRLAQIELSGVPLTVSGNETSASLRYTQTVPTDLVGFSVRLPADAASAVIDPTPAREPVRNQAGDTLYTLPSAEMAPGDSQLVSVSYTTGGATQQPSDADTGNIIGVLLALLAVAVVVLVLVISRNRRPQ